MQEFTRFRALLGVNTAESEHTLDATIVWDPQTEHCDIGILEAPQEVEEDPTCKEEIKDAAIEAIRSENNGLIPSEQLEEIIKTFSYAVTYH